MPYEGVCEYASIVKKLFDLDVEPTTIPGNLFPVREEPFVFNCFKLRPGDERWNRLYQEFFP